MKYFTTLVLLIIIFSCCHKSIQPEGDPWQKLTSSFGGQLLQVQFVSHDTGYILGLNTDIGNRFNALLQSTDNGKTWHSQTFPEPEPGGVGVMFTFNPRLIFTSKYGIFKSIDNGISWIVTDTVYNSILNSTHGIYFFDPIHGITIKGASVYETNDGSHFNEIYVDASGLTLQQMQFVSTTTGYIKGGDPRSNFGFILKSTDKGTSWQHLEFNYGFINSVFFVNDNLGYSLVALDIYRTSNGGNSWTKVNNAPVGENDGGKLLFLNVDEGFLMTPHTGIFHTVDQGKTWTLEHTETGLQLNDISTDGSNNIFVVGQDGTILFRSHH